MAELIPYILALLGAVITGVLVYVATRLRDKDESRARLFDDALQLATAHKEAWEDASDELETLRQEVEKLTREVEALRSQVAQAIRDGEMWRGVAVHAYQEEVRRTGNHPLWWPKGEPCPAMGG